MASVSHRASKQSSSPPCDSHGTTAVAQQVCVDHLYAYVGIAHASVMCVLCMIRKHVACAKHVPCATTTAVLFKVTNTWFLLNTVLSHTADHAHAGCVTCASLFNLRHPQAIHVTHIPCNMCELVLLRSCTYVRILDAVGQRGGVSYLLIASLRVEQLLVGASAVLRVGTSMSLSKQRAHVSLSIRLRVPVLLVLTF